MIVHKNLNKPQDYLTSRNFTNAQRSILFNLRSMSENSFRDNFHKMYNDKRCQICKTDIDNQEHVLTCIVKRKQLRELPIKKSRIRETKHLSTDADSSTDAIGGWTKAKSAKKTNFILRGDFRPLPNKNVQMLDHVFPLLFPKDSESLTILDI